MVIEEYSRFPLAFPTMDTSIMPSKLFFFIQVTTIFTLKIKADFYVKNIKNLQVTKL